MKKEFSKFQIATLKRVAQSVYPLVRMKTKLLNKVEEAQKELDSIQIQIEAFQGPIREMTGGYSTEDLVVREVVDTGKLDKDNKPVKMTTWKLKYPDTIIPQIEESEPVAEEQTTPQEVQNQEEFDFDAENVEEGSDELPVWGQD